MSVVPILEPDTHDAIFHFVGGFAFDCQLNKRDIDNLIELNGEGTFSIHGRNGVAIIHLEKVMFVEVTEIIPA